MPELELRDFSLIRTRQIKMNREDWINTTSDSLKEGTEEGREEKERPGESKRIW